MLILWISSHRIQVWVMSSSRNQPQCTSMSTKSTKKKLFIMTSNVKKLSNLCVRAGNVHQPSVLIGSLWSQLWKINMCGQGNQEIQRFQRKQYVEMTRIVNHPSLRGQSSPTIPCGLNNQQCRQERCNLTQRRGNKCNLPRKNIQVLKRCNHIECWWNSRRHKLLCGQWKNWVQDVTSTTKAQVQKRNRNVNI